MRQLVASPRFIYFDLGNVLVHFDHRRGARQMAEVAGISEHVVQEIVFEGDLLMEYERGAITTQEFYEAFCDRTSTRPDCDLLLLAASDIFELNESIVPLLKELRETGHRLGILSNTNEAHWKFIADGRFPMIQEFFERYALSYEMQAAKPDLAAYSKAAAIADVAPEEIFFTDDRLDNVEGALAAGFDVVQFVETETLRADLRSRHALA
ncbi:MAG: HAD family phosphatase [Planctomycetaceae bacterium]|nr:HAD family phosphatase [Planctomycetales bacterium]MCB9875290.1 HAD family phosphatase [Planctomycetaceae bacterium]MCB9938926.1 HAD family phosphatase [Planctomycetaceae bacterium]